MLPLMMYTMMRNVGYGIVISRLKTIRDIIHSLD